MIRIFIFIFFSSSLLAQSSFDHHWNKLIGHKQLENASLGFMLLDLEDGSTVKEHQKDLLLIPASSLKVLVTGTALSVYGKDHTFETNVFYTGDLDDDGNLSGNIIIQGGGDPTLGSDRFSKRYNAEAFFETVAKEIKKVGIKCIDGYILADASGYPSSTHGSTWAWEDLGNYYASGAWGLNIHENLFELTFNQQAKEGAAVNVRNINPAIPGMQVISEVKSGAKGSGDNAYIFGAPFQSHRIVRGTIPPGIGRFTIKGSVPNPVFLCAYYLNQALKKNGISSSNLLATNFTQPDLIPEYSKAKKVFSYSSPPLSEIVDLANSKSINLFCDAMLFELAKTNGEISVENGLEVIKDTWKTKGLDLEEFYLFDGSGLSSRNAISPNQLASFMRGLSQEKEIFEQFLGSLAVAGESGTMRGMLQDSPAKGKIFAKSGYIDRVLTYTGFIFAKNGKKYAFSVMINNFHGKTSPLRYQLGKLFESIYLL